MLSAKSAVKDIVKIIIGNGMKMSLRHGRHLFKVPFDMADARPWELNTPYLYQIQVKTLVDGKVTDMQAKQFGTRSFVQDTESEIKGMFYLNGNPIRLRGANTMGFEQQDVLRGDYEQLVDDILLAKLCNMNFLRLTQRPVQTEVYDYCDRLGLMTQTDLPLFACMRRFKIAEGIRQAEEMERLVRSHPCNIMVSYINEPMPNADNKPHRHLEREELEGFFTCCDVVVKIQNPDRVYSNIIDSTYSDGSESTKNKICDEWEIAGISAGVCGKNFFDASAFCMENIKQFSELTINGQKTKTVMPGEFFSTDPMTFDVQKDEYLCIEITFKGNMIPYHEEIIIPAFKKTQQGWTSSNLIPCVGMVGCNRKVKGRIAFIGDSITQGIGTQINSYTHWNARLARMLGDNYAFWNLGIGYGRASDIASDGAWLYKSMQNNVVIVCYGVNDLLQGATAEQVKSDLTIVTDKLKNKGIKVVLQTVPPFDYDIEKYKKWIDINKYITNVLSKKVDLVFDVVPYLQESPQMSYKARYGGHPNSEGCRVWADALYSKLKILLDLL